MHYSIFSHENVLQYKPTMNFGSLTYGKKIRAPRYRRGALNWLRDPGRAPVTKLANYRLGAKSRTIFVFVLIHHPRSTMRKYTPTARELENRVPLMGG